jgi:hypothetical protein
MKTSNPSKTHRFKECGLRTQFSFHRCNANFARQVNARLLRSAEACQAFGESFTANDSRRS